jgi:hypothetical protein
MGFNYSYRGYRFLWSMPNFLERQKTVFIILVVTGIVVVFSLLRGCFITPFANTFPPINLSNGIILWQ